MSSDYERNKSLRRKTFNNVDDIWETFDTCTTIDEVYYIIRESNVGSWVLGGEVRLHVIDLREIISKVSYYMYCLLGN